MVWQSNAKRTQRGPCAEDIRVTVVRTGEKLIVGGTRGLLRKKRQDEGREKNTVHGEEGVWQWVGVGPKVWGEDHLGKKLGGGAEIDMTTKTLRGRQNSEKKKKRGDNDVFRGERTQREWFGLGGGELLLTSCGEKNE